MKDGKTTIIEGPHVSPAFVLEMMSKYKNQCLCYNVIIKD